MTTHASPDGGSLPAGHRSAGAGVATFARITRHRIGHTRPTGMTSPIRSVLTGPIRLRPADVRSAGKPLGYVGTNCRPWIARSPGSRTTPIVVLTR